MRKESQRANPEYTRPRVLLHRTLKDPPAIQGEHHVLFARNHSRLAPYLTLMTAIPLAGAALVLSELPRRQVTRERVAQKSREATDQNQNRRINAARENTLARERDREGQTAAKETRRGNRAAERTRQNTLRSARTESPVDPRDKAEAFRQRTAGTSRAKQGQRRG